MKKKKETKPFYISHGIISNSGYALGLIRKYSPKTFPIMIIGVFAGASMSLIWSYIGKYVIDLVQTLSDGGEWKALLPLLLIAAAIELVAMSLNTFCQNKVWVGFVSTRLKAMSEQTAKGLSMNYQNLENPDMLDAQSRALNACSNNDEGVEGMMRNIYQTAQFLLTMVATFAAVVALDFRLIIVIAIMSVMQFLFFKHMVKRDKKEVWNVLAPTWRKINYMQYVTQDFDYAKDIRLFSMQKALSQKQHDILSKKQSVIFHSKNLWLGNTAFSQIIELITNAAIYGALIFSVIGKDMTIGDFTLYLGLAGAFSNALNGFLIYIGNIKKCSMQTDDYRSFLEAENSDNGELPLPEEKLTIEFKNVSYRYKGASDYALKNLNLTLDAGMRLAVVGMNGAGKTTFIKLLLRLYDPTEGEILLNGTNINKFSRTDYYKLFSPVFQNVEIFAFPICENVSMATPELTDKVHAENCIINAGLGDKLKSLEKGVDTQLLKVLYEDGIDLSGGEKQKLALARALYKNAPIVVLDEPTAALDPLAEYELYRSFDEMIGDKSAVYISHRLSSTRFCDVVAMFIDGELREYGTHEELLNKGGEYSKMFEVQAQYYKDKEREASET